MTLYKIKKQADKDLALKLAINCLSLIKIFGKNKKQMIEHIDEQIKILEYYIGDNRTRIERFYSDGSPIITIDYDKKKRKIK